MKTKLLFLSLALMTMGEVSEVKADTTIADLTATNTESTYIHGALADYSYWTLEGTGGGMNSGTSAYIAWFFTRNTTNTLFTTSDVELPVGTYLLSSNLVKWKSSTNTLAITSEDGTTEFATKTINVVGKNYTAFYVGTAQKVKFTFTVKYGNSNGETHIGEQVLYTVKKDDAIADYTTILNNATTAQIESMIAGISEAKKALSDMLATANANYDKESLVGTGVFQLSGSLRSALKTAIDAAQEVYNSDSSTDSDYVTATTSLSAANTAFMTTLNAPNPAKYYYIKYDSKYINICEYTTTNWDTNRTLALLTSLPYAVQFEAYSAEDNQYYIKANGKYLGQYSGYNWAPAVLDSPDGYFTAELDASGVKFANSWGSYQLATGTVGDYTYLSLNNNNTVRSFTVEEAATTNASIFISSSADWGTFVAPFAVNLTGDLAGVEAYTITTDGTTITKSEALSTIPANTPVLLHKTGGLSATNVKGYAQSYYTGLPEEGNLVGFLASGGSVPASEADGDTYYVLQKQDEVVGWYKVTSALTGTANRAYLKVPAGGEARQFMPLFGDSETTAIMSVNTEGITANDYYNLNGQRVSQPAKGLYIVGGKKVMVK